MVEKNERRLSASFEENIRYMNEVLPVKESFDIIRRDMKIGGKASVFYYIGHEDRRESVRVLLHRRIRKR